MIYRFGNYELDAQRCELRCADELVAIEPKVFEALVYLLEHRDRVVTKEELLEQCWSGTFVSEAALTRCLAKVRKTVQPEPAGPPVIKTRYGGGYASWPQSPCCLANPPCRSFPLSMTQPRSLPDALKS